MAVKIVTRAQWGARAATSTSKLTEPVTYVFIHHSDGSGSTDLESGKKVVQGIQNYHMDDAGHKWSDIAYSFLIGGDGTVFEGRGWGVVGAHTKGYNSTGYGLCFLGIFASALPTAEAISAAKALIDQAVADDYLIKEYQLKGHRQVGSTDCPGTKLFDEIQTWPQFTA